MEDTITAISTLVGESAINIIKVSGKDSIKIVNKIFNGKNLLLVKSHTIHYGYIINNKEIIDEVLVSVFKEPKTYTKENVVEINCHGGISTTNKILELLLEKGCRLAEPGEFIKRAYLNGRINLIQAEAVADIISSRSEVARKIGVKGLIGESSKLVKTLREELLSLIANIEVNIDYPEYDDALIVTNKLLKEKVKYIKENLIEVIKQSENQLLLKDGLNVCIVGKPNVGKSSILNKLIEEEKAIVTDIEGTTRDIVEGNIILKGINIHLIDTAGIRETTNIVEELGVKKSYKVIENSDLILLVLDNSEKLSQEDFNLLKEIDNKKAIIVVNKSDKEKVLDESILKNNTIIHTNTLDSKGVEAIREKIITMFELNQLELKDFTYLSNSRQISILKECLKILINIESQVKEKIEVDLIQIDIKILWDKLGEITGETYKEDLIEEIFKNFCLGK